MINNTLLNIFSINIYFFVKAKLETEEMEENTIGVNNPPPSE